MYPSSLRRRAISTFIRELGMVACSCSALLALRMRVSMSAIGSVSTVLSPTSSTSSCRESRPGARARGGRSGRGRTCGRPRAGGRTGCSACSCAPCTSGVAAVSRRGTSWPLLLSPVAVREGQAEGAQQRESLLVVLGARRDRHVEPADLLDVVVVDLGEDELLTDAEREVAAAIHRARVETA